MLSTTEDIQNLFNRLTTQKQAHGLNKEQAESLSITKIMRGVMLHEIEPSAARDFVIQYRVSNGSTLEEATDHVYEKFAGIGHTFFGA
jgi:hypothetical protein